MTVNELVEEFLADVERRTKLPPDNGERLSKKTMREYRNPLVEVLLPFCQRVGIDDLADLNAKALERLRESLVTDGAKSGRPLATPTVNSYLRSINACLNWAKKKRDQEGVRTIELVKAKRQERDVLNRGEIDRMEAVAELERDKLIVRVLADTGIRVGELVSLRTSDVLDRNGQKFVRVRGKTGERLVPIPKLYPRLQRYATATRPKNAGSDRLFLARRRRPGGDIEPLTESGVQQIVRELAEEAGIGRRVHPHLFRHSFITWQLQRGTHPMMLKKIVGHTTTAMIDRIYEHMTGGDTYEAMLRSLEFDTGK